MTTIEIVAQPGVPQVVITREFAASPQVLFRAHTEPDLISQWLGPDFLKTTVDVLEPRDGGRWRYTHTDRDGVRYSSTACTTAIRRRTDRADLRVRPAAGLR